MKGTFIALLALVAAPALASEEQSTSALGKPIFFGAAPLNEITVDKSTNTGSLAGHAAALAGSAVTPDAEFYCQLPTRAVSGAPPNAANIDGMYTTA